MHAHSCFVTLTYSEDKLPPGGSLRPKDVQDWLKRIRRAAAPAALRFFLVGEYGDLTHRPHYHVALFGFPPCEHGRSRYKFYKNCCRSCDLIRDTWKHGHIDVGMLERESAQYVAGYVTKKMTHSEERCTSSCTHPPLNGRHPEFARMSLRPGIGATAMEPVSQSLCSALPGNVTSGMVPQHLAHGSVTMPLGKYLRAKLREKLGIRPEPMVSSRAVDVFADRSRIRETLGLVKSHEELQAFSVQMHELLKDALQAPENKSRSIASIVKKTNEQKALNLAVRTKIKSKGKML